MTKPDFPKSLPEFMRRFPDERACFDYLIEARWPGGKFRCPSCGCEDAYPRHEDLAVECAKCKKIVTATSGTVMHGSRQPLLSWLLAAWTMVVDKRGTSAKQLQRTLDLKRNETAYMMLHKLRAAMVAPERTLLEGVVEVDETFLGSRASDRYMEIAGAVEVQDRGPSRLRFRHLDKADGPNLQRFVRDVVAPGSTICTDGNPSYDALGKDYRHEVQVAGKGYAKAEVLEHFHTAVTNLKAWLLGTFHGAVSPDLLQAYLNEFAFRYNRRHNLPAAFQTVLGIATRVEGPTYKGLEDRTYSIPNPGHRPGKRIGAAAIRAAASRRGRK